MGANLKNYFLLSLLVVLISACGGGSTVSSGSSADVGGEGGESLEGGSVTEIDFDEDTNSAILTFNDITASQRFVLSLYHYNEDGDTEAYQLSSVNAGTGGVNSLLTPSVSTLSNDATEDFHQWLREAESELDESAHLGSSSIKAVKKLTTPSLGSEKAFKVLNSFSGSGSYATVNATVRYITDNFLAYVDNRNTGNLTDGDLEDLLAPFEALVVKERNLFGGTESDVNGDGRFAILFTQEVNELGAAAGGIITGFFYAVDLFSTSKYAQSNEMEIFYTYVPDPSGDYGTPISKSFSLSNILPSVLPHEFQHMINFNMHYFENDGSAENSWLNEGLSHLAEDIYSLNGSDYMTETGIENPARVSGYLAQTDSLCFTCGSSLYQRGGSYLFVRYLYEQAEKGNLSAASIGSDLISRLMNTDQVGTDNIVQAVYGSTASSTKFRDLVGQFGLALFMSDTGLTSDSRLQFDGIDLRGAQNDNRGTVLNGPAVDSIDSFPLTDTLGGTSITYLEITGEDIEEAGGQISIQVSDESSAGGYLVQTGL